MTDITITLNNIDAAGNPTGDTRSVTLSIDAISDVINHAAQLSILKRQGLNAQDVMSELIEAVESYGLIDDKPDTDPGLPTP